MSNELLRGRAPEKVFQDAPAAMLHAVDDVSFTARTQARLWASWASPAAASPRWAAPSCGLHEPTGGKVLFDGPGHHCT